MDKTFLPTEGFNKAVEVARELDYSETWHFIKHLQRQLAEKAYVAANAKVKEPK